MLQLTKRIFCRHDYEPERRGSYVKLGWLKCRKCGKEKYDPDDTEFTEFRFP